MSDDTIAFITTLACIVAIASLGADDWKDRAIGVLLVFVLLLPAVVGGLLP